MTTPRRGRALACSVAVGLLALAAACGSTSPSSSAPSAGGKIAPASSASAPAAPSSAAPAAATLTPLTVVYAQQTASVAPIYLAADRGLFRKYGLAVKLEQVGGPTSMAALISGEAQFCVCGATEAVNAHLSKSAVVLIGALDDSPQFHLLVAKDIHTVSDLEGKKVALVTLGGPVVPTMHIILAHFHVPANRVQLISAGGTVQGSLALLEKGVAAGALFPPPFSTTAQKAGFTDLVDAATLGVPMVTTGISALEPYITSHRATAVAFMRAVAEAASLIRDPSNRAAVVASIQRHTHIPAAVAQLAYTDLAPIWSSPRLPRVDPVGLQNALKYSGIPTVEAVAGKTSEFVDNSVMNAVGRGS